MATEEVDDLFSQAPPAKRARLDNEISKIESLSPINDMDNFYGPEEKSATPKSVPEASFSTFSTQETFAPSYEGIPGLGRLGNAPAKSQKAAEVPIPPTIAGEICGRVEGSNGPSMPADINTEMSGLENTSKETEQYSEASGGPSMPEDVNTEISGVENASEETGERLEESNGWPMPENVKIEVFRVENSTEGLRAPIIDKMEPEVVAAVNPAKNSGSTNGANQETEHGELALSQASGPVPATMMHTSPEQASSRNSPSRPLTHALEALLGGLDSPAPKATDSENTLAVQEEPVAEEHPEWEVDSSPYESSSDSSSDESSSEEDSEDEENAYKLLSPEEQARILMEGDGGSDDEGGAAKAKGPGGQLRTKNEVPEEVIPKPNVTITPEMQIEELGVVETIVENIVLIKAKISGEYKALESGSVLCLADRSVIGVVSETLGRVQQPLYTVRFTNMGEITEAGISMGTKVFYTEQYANYALTQVLKAYKGSDASNLHDEEVGDEEIEFSDDEAEAEHKRRLKQKRLEKRGGKMQQNGGLGRGGAHAHAHPLQQQHLHPNGSTGLSYEEADDDGPYKPLSRPTGFADTVGRSEAPQEGPYTPGISNRGRSDIRSRGRSDRGRGRGDRGRGRGFQDRRENNGYSQPPQNYPNGGYGQPNQSSNSHAHSPFNTQQSAGIVPLNPNNFYGPLPQQGQQSPQPPQMWPQFSQMPFQGFPNMPNGWSNMPPPPPLLTGAFINPAFFAANQQGASNQWDQQRQQGGPDHNGSFKQEK